MNTRQSLLIGILILAFALRLSLLAQERVIKWDEPDYLTLGINLVTGKGYTTGVAPELHYTPLFPIVTGMLYLVTRDAETSSDLVYLITGTALILPVFLITRRIYHERAALIAGLLLAVFPALSAGVLFWGTMTEPLYILLTMAAAWFLLLAMDENAGWAFGAGGLLLGLAYLTRPEASTNVAILLGYLAVVRLAEGRLWQRTTLVNLLVLVLAFTLVAAPYLGWLYEKSGKLLITGKLGITYAMGQAVLEHDPALYDRLIASLDATGDEIVWYSDERFAYSIVDQIASHPDAAIQRTIANARRLAEVLFSRTIFPTALAIPLLVGLFSHPWDGRRLRHELFLIAVAAPVLSFLPFHVEVRFFAPALPILLVWVARGLDDIGLWLTDSAGAILGRGVARLGEGLSLVPTAITVFVLVFIIPLAMEHGQKTTDYTHKRAGLWLRTNSPPQSVIMSRDLAIALYAQRPWVPSPNAEYSAVMRYARRHNVAYYVVDTAEITILRPQLAFILDLSNPPAELLPVHVEQMSERATIIYALR